MNSPKMWWRESVTRTTKTYTHTKKPFKRIKCFELSNCLMINLANINRTRKKTHFSWIWVCKMCLMWMWKIAVRVDNLLKHKIWYDCIFHGRISVCTDFWQTGFSLLLVFLSLSPSHSINKQTKSTHRNWWLIIWLFYIRLLKWHSCKSFNGIKST